jgi:N-methylhydantoinase A/oxoprolinase/acetone carboxylase beta subunit
MFTVDIDTGGTMTDALVSNGSEIRTFKVDTTPHDLTVSFRECLVEAARQFGYDGVQAFLDNVNLIRWSSTITSNVLGERRGAKVGLLVSRGHEQGLYAPGRSPIVDELVDEQNVIGLPDNPTTQDVLGAVKGLLEEGVRRVCVSLKSAFPDNRAELQVKSIIERQYPDHYLGAVPVLLGSEMAQISDDTTRTHYSVINAYVHSQLAASLFKAEDALKYDDRWSGPLLIGHTNGGVARVGKTKAVDTIESGPIFGTFGGAYFARRYSIPNVVCFDVGGTTTKASVVRNGEPVFQRGGNLVGIPVKTSLAMLGTAVLGGGSIARPDKEGQVSLGPESMGASPGPACYALGGSEATLTDALLVLGYLDAKAFLGGRRSLNLELAAQAIQRNLANPLGVSVEQGAALVRDEAISIMADLVRDILEEGRLDPSGVSLFAYGGNGPLFGAVVAERLGIPDVVVFNLSPVFSAFGSAISDVVHVYERGIGANIAEPGGAGQVGDALRQLHSLATRDLSGEGFAIGQAKVEIQAEMSDGEHAPISVRAEGTQNGVTSGALLQAYQRQASGHGQRALVQSLTLKVTHPIGKYELPRLMKGDGGTPKSTSKRPIVLDSRPLQAQLYLWSDLDPGSAIGGPAIVTADTLTCLVPAGWRITIDEFGNGRLARELHGKAARSTQ